MTYKAYLFGHLIYRFPISKLDSALLHFGASPNHIWASMPLAVSNDILCLTGHSTYHPLG